MTATPTDHPAIKLFGLYLALVTVLAGGMRLYKLADWSFWEDELYSVRSAASLDKERVSKRIGQLPTRLSLIADGSDLSEINRGNVARWRTLGVKPLGARLGPCLIGILTIPLLGWAGRRLLGDRASLIMAVLPAVSATRGELFPWLNDRADLKRYYDLRILQTFASVRVYYYLPPWTRNQTGLDAPKQTLNVLKTLAAAMR